MLPRLCVLTDLEKRTDTGVQPSPESAIDAAEMMADPATTPPEAMPDAATRRILPWLVAIAFLMQSMDTTILNTAVPTIARDLAVSELTMQAVLSSYTLTLAVFIPVSGWLADRLGTRIVFTGAIALFTTGSLLCGLCRAIEPLILCRVIQGVGGAMMVPVGRLTIIKGFPKSELVRAMSFVAIPSLVGPLLGPLIGGLILSVLPWRYVFFINLPIGILGIACVWRYLPDFREHARPRLDGVGFVLFGSGIALFSWVLQTAGERASTATLLFPAGFAAVLLLGLYWRHARRAAAPLLDTKLLDIRTFAVSAAGGLVTRIGVGGAPFLLPILYQSGLGMTPLQSGLLIMPQAIGALTSKIFVTYALRFLGFRSLLTANTVTLGAMLVLFGTVGPTTPVWLIVVQATIYGIAMSMQFTCINTLAYADVPTARSSHASSFASTLQQLSMSVGVATAGLLTGLLVPRGAGAVTSLVSGLHAAFFLLGGLTVVSATIFLKLRRDDADNVSGRAPRTDAESLTPHPST